MVQRPKETGTLKRLLKQFPVVGIVGARQVGKTTLARLFGKETGGASAYFDLENSADLARLSDPMLALQGLKGLVIIDEIQRMPELFPVLRVLVDRPRARARFLLLGSASPELLRQGSESLAGRISYHELHGFSLGEVGVKNSDRLWVRGGFPDSYLARSAVSSSEWRRSFIRTFLERDLPQLGVGVRSATLCRFWLMLAYYHGQTWNSSELARSLGVADTTVRNYLDLLTGALVVRQLLPWHENVGKRQVKAPKVYISDPGILHTLLGLNIRGDVEGHPKSGASWEGFVLHQVVRHIGAQPEECFFWAPTRALSLTCWWSGAASGSVSRQKGLRLPQ
ncbi:MAG: ATP-binding protein [Bacteroidota bacterium]